MIERRSDYLKGIMTAQEVSEYLKIPLSSLYSLTKQGKIRGVKVGKHWRYRAEDIRRYCAGPSVTDVIASIAHHTNPHKDRAYQRINCEIPAGTKILLERKQSFELNGQIQNLSEGGLLFLYDEATETPQENTCPVEVGDPIKVSFDIGESVGDDDSFLELQGRVVHKTSGGHHALGIKFKSLDSTAQERIRAYVG